MPTTETIEKQNECKERVRNSRRIDWEAVAGRLRAVREKVPGNATTADKRAHCCGLQEWARILWPDESKSHTKISQLERGKQTPDLDTLLRYAAAGGVSLEWLLYGEEEKKEDAPNPEDISAKDFCRAIANAVYPLRLNVSLQDTERDGYKKCCIAFDYEDIDIYETEEPEASGFFNVEHLFYTKARIANTLEKINQLKSSLCDAIYQFPPKESIYDDSIRDSVTDAYRKLEDNLINALPANPMELNFPD